MVRKGEGQHLCWVWGELRCVSSCWISSTLPGTYGSFADKKKTKKPRLSMWKIDDEETIEATQTEHL